MIEVYQAEWCPYSRMVRQRLGELGLPFVAHPVPADRPDRDALRELSGQEGIPVVVLEDGTQLKGDTHEILEELDRRFDEPPGAEDHRRQLEAHGGL
jgi:glutaredoxin 3